MLPGPGGTRALHGAKPKLLLHSALLLQHRVTKLTEPQNGSGWKGPLRFSSPALPPALMRNAQDCLDLGIGKPRCLFKDTPMGKPRLSSGPNSPASPDQVPAELTPADLRLKTQQPGLPFIFAKAPQPSRGPRSTTLLRSWGVSGPQKIHLHDAGSALPMTASTCWCHWPHQGDSGRYK